MTTTYRGRALLLGAMGLLISVAAFAQSNLMPVRDTDGDAREQHDADDPAERARYIQQHRGKSNGVDVGKARQEALRQRDAQVAAQGTAFQQAAASGILPSIASNSSTWTPIGPSPSHSNNAPGDYQTSSGRVTAIAVDPKNFNVVYIGGAQGGVWRTLDGSASNIQWTPLTDNKESLAMGAIAIDPTSTCDLGGGVMGSCTIYAGTGESSNSGDSYYGAGILKSTDGGATWTRLSASGFDGTNGRALAGLPSISAIAVNPGKPQMVLAAVDGSPSGIYLSTDGGNTWSAKLTGATGYAVAYDPFCGNAQGNCVAYAGMGSGMGIFRSTDGGATWLASNNSGISGVLSDRSAIAVFDSQNVYVAFGAANLGSSLYGVFKTTDGGLNWSTLHPVDFCTSQCWYDLTMAVHPANKNVLFVGGSGFPNSSYVQKSVDGGASWTVVNGNNSVHADQHAMAFSPNGATFWLGNDGGVYSTTDSGTGTTVNWVERNNSLQIAQYYPYFALHPTDPDITYAGAQDNGVQRYDGTQIASQAWDEVACGDGAGAVINQVTPSTVYANCQGVDLRSSTTGNAGSFFTIGNSISTSDSRLFISPLVGDPTSANLAAGSQRLYFGTVNLWQSIDSGNNWAKISANSLVPGAQGSDGVSNIHVAPHDTTGNTVYFVTSLGGVGKATNALGVSPNTALLSTNLTLGQEYLSAIVTDPGDENTVYLTAAGFGHGHVFRSTNGGTSWTDISGNLPDIPVNDIVVDPDQPGVLYIGTDVGVYSSTVGSGSWSPLANGMPNVAVFGLKLHRPSRTLRAATHGRGMWDLFVPFTVTGPGSQLAPGSLSFGSQDVNTTSGSQTLVLSNNGSQSTSVSAISSSNPEFALALPAGCVPPFTLTTSATCNIGVTFTPTTVGARSSTVTVTSNAANSPAKATLSGTGQKLAPNDNFANATVVSSIVFHDTVTTTAATTEPGEVAPDANCVGAGFITNNYSVWYNYTPSTDGVVDFDTIGSDYDTVLSIWTGNSVNALTEVACNDDLPGQFGAPSHLSNVAVTGGVTYHIMASGWSASNPTDNGTLVFNFNSGPAPVSHPQLLAYPASLTFPSQMVNSTSTVGQVIRLTAANASVTNITPSLSAEFSVSNNNCPTTLAAGSSCNVTVQFTPAALGQRTGTATITSSAENSPAGVSLQGAGKDLNLLLLRPSRPGRSVSGQSPAGASAASLSLQLAVNGGDAQAATEVFLHCEAPATVSCSLSATKLLVTDEGGAVEVRLALRNPRLGTRKGTAEVHVIADVEGAQRAFVYNVDLATLAPPYAKAMRLKRR